MKKIVLFGIAVAAMLTACSNDDVVDVKAPAKATPIGFNTFVENATRTVTGEVKASTIDEFAVWGFTTADGKATQIFNQEAVTKGTDGWSYENTQYWVDGNAYAFAAISPVPVAASDGNVGNGIEYEFDEGVPTGTITFTQSDAAQTDLVYAYDNTTTSGTVGFNFNHLLSRVALKVTNSSENAQNTAIVISNVKLTNAISSGKYSTTTNQNWSDRSSTTKDIYLGTKGDSYPASTETNAVSVTGYDSYGLSKGNSTTSGWSYIIPYEEAPSAGYTITFDVVVYKAVTNAAGTTGADYIRYPQSDSDVYTVTITTTGANAQMNKGYSYVYGLELKVDDLKDSDGNPIIEPIKFTVSSDNGVAGWTENTSNPVAATLSSSQVTTTNQN